jgi:aldehyde dehydrogenase (NAD+)
MKDFEDLVMRQREWFEEGHTRELKFRLSQLDLLEKLVRAHDEEILEALRLDLGKPAIDAYTAEVAMVLAEIRHARRNLPGWMKSQRRTCPLPAKPGRASVHFEPKGLVLIIGPWNYPFQLLIVPLVGAIAAGNCAVLKPSELAPHTSSLVFRIFENHFDRRFIAVSEGGRDAAEELLNIRFDHIFFTGSSHTGRKVMTAAARHLTPVTLELGGKCPAIVCGDIPESRLRTVARRIVWGKFMNSGQTCVAPDYVLVSRNLREPLISAMRTAIDAFYQQAGSARIVNLEQFERLLALLEDGEIVCGGITNADRLTISPTLLTNVALESSAMQGEIFGPILPILTFDAPDDALEIVRRFPAPLAVYPFTLNLSLAQRIVAETRSGGVCINDTILHMTHPDLPFGGVAESGIGRYHGRASFDCFSHQRVVLHRGLRFDPGIRYQTTKMPLSKLKKLLRRFAGA